MKALVIALALFAADIVTDKIVDWRFGLEESNQ